MAEVRICAVGDVPEREARRFEVAGHEVCLVNLGPAGFRAVGNICSHAQAYLHEGEVDADLHTIECPRHGSTFDLDSGRPTSLPATLPVPTHEVKVEGDDVLIEVNHD